MQGKPVQNRHLERLWKEFFRDPSQWCDQRVAGTRCADFRHRQSGQPLWILNVNNPPWVDAELRRCGFLAEPDSLSSLWKAFFRDPSEWWDYRSLKRTPLQPDFLHKWSHQGLWMCGASTPSWVRPELISRRLLSFLMVLWVEFLRDPSEWWDNRSSKTNPAAADFVHKCSDHRLWLSDIGIPFWINAELRSRGLFEPKPIRNPASLAFMRIKICTRNRDLVEGTLLHRELAQQGLVETCSGALATMYATCGHVAKAKMILDVHKVKDVVPWNALIACYVREKQGQCALDCHAIMQHEGICPTAITFVSVLSAGALTQKLDIGEKIYDKVLQHAFLHDNEQIACSFINLYANCRGVSQARQVLDKIPFPTSVRCWIKLLSLPGLRREAVATVILFEQMQQEGVLPDVVIYNLVLGACSGACKVMADVEFINKTDRKSVKLESVAQENHAGLSDPVKSCSDVISWEILAARLRAMREKLSYNSLDCLWKGKTSYLS